MDDKVKKWRKDGKHYPPILRDFHDQKDLFKMIHRIIDVEEHQYCGDVNWLKGHCYVIDIFLWAMARFGYTLQKSRAKLDFESIQESLEACANERIQCFIKKTHNQPLNSERTKPGRMRKT